MHMTAEALSEAPATSSSIPPPRVAALTIVRDEPFFLPLWHRHYSRAFAPDDLYCLHHVTTAEEQVADPAFAEALRLFRKDRVECVVEPLFDPVWLRKVVRDRVGTLLAAGYSAVLFAEVDELLVPANGNLATYVVGFANSGRTAVRCIGWEVHHDMTSEPSLDLSRPVLAQRGWWHRNAKYDKVRDDAFAPAERAASVSTANLTRTPPACCPLCHRVKALLTTVPLAWSLGFHECEESVPLDEGWLLVHLHKYDFQAFLARHEARCKYEHAPEAIERQWNAHYRASGGALVAQYLNLPAALEPIPSWVRDTALPGI
jgi:hypothetical protein